MTPKHIVLHHSAVAGTKPQYDGINKSHKQRGFPKSSLGSYVGYHVLIEADGTVRKCREYTEIGAHCQAQGRNYDSIGICLAGNFSEHLPTEAQRKALWECIDDVQSKYKIVNIRPHRAWGKTECWGKLLSDDVLSEVIKDTPVVHPSDWAIEAIEKAKAVGILDWNNPKEEVGNMTMAWMLRKAGIISSIFDGENYVPIENGHGYLTKEQVAVALNRMGAFDS